MSVVLGDVLGLDIMVVEMVFLPVLLRMLHAVVVVLLQLVLVGFL